MMKKLGEEKKFYLLANGMREISWMAVCMAKEYFNGKRLNLKENLSKMNMLKENIHGKINEDIMVNLRIGKWKVMEKCIGQMESIIKVNSNSKLGQY